MRKGLKKLLTPIITFFVSVVVLTFVTNEIVFRSQIPESFESNFWKGKWNSKKGKLIGGKLMVEIPNPIMENSKFKGRAMIYYNIWSLYQPGQIRIGEIEAVFGSKSFTETSNLPDIPIEEIEDISSNFYKADLNLSEGQYMVLTGLKLNDKNYIYGTYLSNFAAAFGQFKLKAIE